MIEPGNYIAGTSLYEGDKIDADAKEMWDKMTDEVKDAYGEDLFKARKDLMRTYANFGYRDLTPVTRSLTASLLDVFPQVRYQPADLQFRLRYFIATHLPEIFHDLIYGN